MNEKFYNNNLFEVVKIAFELLEIKLPVTELLDNKTFTNKNSKLTLSTSNLDEFGYNYIRINLQTDAKKNYMLWGYVNPNLDEFIVDDFTIIKDLAGEMDLENFFRDVINTPEAEEYTAQMLKEIKSL